MLSISVDFDEELSAVFGGVLDDQSIYLDLCIKAVLNLYKDLPNPPKSVSIIAHSMVSICKITTTDLRADLCQFLIHSNSLQGGKVAQSVLMNRETANRVNTVIALAAPLDKPVLNIDFYTEAFYRKTNKLWSEHRPPNPNLITNLTNTCCNASNFEQLHFNADDEQTALAHGPTKRYFLEDILLITIGGGSRDILVHSGLTTSKFSDIHVVSTCIPGVWLTTDHLASVWCLQQVIAINRFLYSIMEPIRQRKHDNAFIKDKSYRLANAKYHLTVCMGKSL